jgi:o-succinylbenzoate synthase
MTTRDGALVRIRTREGRTGWGEGLPLPAFGTEGEPDFQAALARLASGLMDAALPRSLEGVESALARLGDFARLPTTRAALELALLDLTAQAANLTLSALLAQGGAVQSSIEVNALLTAHRPFLLGAEARAWAAKGFLHFKLKVGVAPEEEEYENAQVVRREVPETRHLRVDANGAWTRAEAEARLRAFAERGVALCEQPVAAQDAEGLRALRGKVGLVIAADESLTDLAQARRLLEGKSPAVDVFVLKPLVLGGLLPALSLAREAAACGVQSYVTSTMDGPVARAGAVHLASVLPAAWAHGLAVGALFESPDAPELSPASGSIKVPHGPGLGVVVEGVGGAS